MLSLFFLLFYKKKFHLLQTILRAHQVKGWNGKYNGWTALKFFIIEMKLFFHRIHQIKKPSEEFCQLLFYRQCRKAIAAFRQYQAAPTVENQKAFRNHYHDLEDIGRINQNITQSERKEIELASAGTISEELPEVEQKLRREILKLK